MEIDFVLSADLEPTFLITCPQCDRVHRHPAADLPEGAELHCGCGTLMEIDGDDFVAIQKSIRHVSRPDPH